MTGAALHAIAAVLWVVAILFAGGAGDQKARGDSRAAKLGLTLGVLLGALAFTLQVLA